MVEKGLCNVACAKMERSHEMVNIAERLIFLWEGHVGDGVLVQFGRLEGAIDIVGILCLLYAGQVVLDEFADGGFRVVRWRLDTF